MRGFDAELEAKGAVVVETAVKHGQGEECFFLFFVYTQYMSIISIIMYSR
jgi:hypothetical protein